MGWYREQVFPRVMNVAMNTAQNREIRGRVCADLRGDVVEIGFGTGHNLPFLSDQVRTLRVVDPSRVGVRLARDRMDDSRVPVEVAGLDGQSLPFDDDSADAVLSTWTLCSIPDAVAALREARRVLRPDGTLHFAEHGLAPDPSVQRWQNRFDGVQQRMAGGCHLNRDIPALLEAGGFRMQRLEQFYVKGEPKAIGSLYEGVAAP